MNKSTRFKVNKLIRDKIPEILLQEGSYKIMAHTMNDGEFLLNLKKKLLEESQEVCEASIRAELIEELADVSEVIRSLCTSSGFTLEDVEMARLKKREQKGGFEKRIYQTAFEMDESHPMYSYFRSRPDKYPEDKNK